MVSKLSKFDFDRLDADVVDEAIKVIHTAS